MNLPQKYRTITEEGSKANTVEWVLLDTEKREIAKSEPFIEDVHYEPIINEEGQTEAEWKRELAQRESEEFWAEVPAFLGNGVVSLVGFCLQGGVTIVVFFFQVVFYLVASLGDSMSRPPRGYDVPRHRPVKRKPTVNVETNVYVTGDADVKTNIHIN